MQSSLKVNTDWETTQEEHEDGKSLSSRGVNFDVSLQFLQEKYTKACSQMVSVLQGSI